MSNPKVVEELSNLKALMIRKENASRRGQRPVKYLPLPASRLPATSPAWFLKKDNPWEFDDPILAIVTLLAKLSKVNEGKT